MTGDAAAQAIRSIDAGGSIGIISTEGDPPYNRPPLTKGLWKGDELDSIWLETPKSGADIRLQREVTSLNLTPKRAVDDSGEEYTFERLLLATGGTPRRLPFEGVNYYYRTIEDYRRLRADANRVQRFAIIGGGFIGAEIAAALAMNGKQVTMLFPEDGIGARVFPSDLSLFLNDYYREKGIEVLAGTNVVGLGFHAGSRIVQTQNKANNSAGEVEAEVVIAGLGITPNIKLAQAAGLQEDNGIIVDRFLRTNNPDVYAAGDVASFENRTLGSRLRVEHEDNAKTMRHVAGLNMAGQETPYDHLPSFYSDLFDLGYEAVGELDSRLETFSDWKKPFHEGVVYYLRGGRVRGVLLWNVWDQVDAGRGVIAEPGPFDQRTLKGRLPQEDPRV